MLIQASQGQFGSAHVVVLGNEKGGSGKSTTALHIAVALMKAGHEVALIACEGSARCASSITFPLGAGAESYATFPTGTIGGPVTVNSDQPVLASQRVQYYQTFNEVWAASASQAPRKTSGSVLRNASRRSAIRSGCPA